MTNLEWLENVKEADGDVDEAIREAKKGLFVDKKAIGMAIMEYRKIKALEIIAEGLIKSNDISGSIITALENIDTTLNRR